MNAPEKKPRRTWNEIVEQHVKSLRFGVVQIVVHEGQVVQIERTEKVRIAPNELKLSDEE
jgi:hypothetical protein